MEMEKPVRFNMNDKVIVKLTEKGHEILQENYNRLANGLYDKFVSSGLLEIKRRYP